MTAQEQISKVVRNCTDLPVSARDMLAKGLPFTFSPPQERHQYQKEFVELLHSCLECALKSESETLASCEQQVKTTTAAHETAIADHAQAVKAEEEARAAWQGKGASAIEASELVKREEVMYKEAKTQNSLMNDHKTALEDDIQQINSIIDDSFKRLVGGGRPAEDRAAKTDPMEDVKEEVKGEMKEELKEELTQEVQDVALQAVQEYLQGISAEPALIAAVPAALRHCPAERGAFDQVTVDTLQRMFQSKKQQLDTKLQSLTPDFVDASSEELGAWAILEVAKEKESEAKHEHAKAKAHLMRAANVVKSAMALVDQENDKLTSLFCDKTLHENKVKEIRDCLASLEKLASGAEEKLDTAMADDEAQAEEGQPDAVGMDVEPTPILAQ